MRLASLELYGFKSFAKKTTLTFDTPISAIVGPNGSGKSNAAEAFRFVLGEQSLKSLRGKKGEDMIFNGGQGATRLNRAAVKLVFDNRNRILPMDFDEISIERTVHRDGLNEYSINGSRVRLKDITELLAHGNIGASGHHIISQGEADRILMASPQERRGMIEDALGLKLFQYRKRESEKKLEKTVENVQRVESLRREVAPHLSYLKKQVEKLEKVRSLRVELTEKAIEYFARESVFVSSMDTLLKNEHSVPQQALQHIHKQIAELNSQLAKITSHDSEQRRDGQNPRNSLVKQVEQARVNINDIKATISKIGGEIAMLSQIIRRHEDERTRTRSVQVDQRELTRIVHDIEHIAGMLSDSNTIDDARGLALRLKDTVSPMKQYMHEEASQSTEMKNYADEVARKQVDMEMFVKSSSDAEHVLAKAVRELEEYDILERQHMQEHMNIERNLVELKGEEGRLIAQLQTISYRIEQNRTDSSLFEQDLGEFAHICGRDILSYAERAKAIPVEVVMSEARHVQQERRKEIERNKIRIEDAAIGSGDDVIKEYKETSEREAFFARELADLEVSRNSLAQVITDLDTELSRRFEEGMQKINSKFGEFFTLMFGGGHAALAIEDMQEHGGTEDINSGAGDEDELALSSRRKRKTNRTNVEEGDDSFDMGDDDDQKKAGIEVTVSLPRKKVSGLAMLSGGERALTSIALLFALSQVNPPPFIILDETDAALDEANSRKYGDMIEALSKHSQLILITHNRETMSRAHILYGVTMSKEGASSILSVKFDQAVAVAK